MLSFATFEEAPASMSLTSLLRRNEATDTSSASYVVTFWFLLGFIYYGFATGGWYEGLSSLPCKLSISVEAMKDRCCPKRRARYLKCARRCNRRKGEAQDESPLDYECWFWQKFYPMHLPPPLPFKRHKTKYKSEDAKDSHAHLNDSTTTVVVNDSSGSVSSRGTVETTHSVALAHQQQVGEVSESSFLKRALPTKIATSTFKPAPPRAPLIDLARMQLWSAILQKVTRREAKYHDMDGLYPLHWACSGGPPIKVIHALLDYYPSAARKVDQEGSTPLHFACHYSASMGVMEALLQVYPKAIRMQDKYGRTPVYHAVHKSAGMEVLDLLLKADAATATTPCVPARAREQVAGDISRSLAVRTPLFLAWAAVLADRRTREEKRGKKWDKAILLLQAAYQHHSNVSPGVPRPFQSLLAALSLDLYLPESVVPVITEAHPEQLEHADPHTGQLPLALAAATSHYSASRSNALIELLLKGYPRAAQSRDRQGRFPLSLAVASGKRWDAGVEHLLRAAPDTLLWRDGQTGLVPAISAASAVVEKHEVGTVSEVSSTRLSTDPFGLLNTKQRESISRRSTEPAPSSIDAAVSTADPETRHVSTIYELINAHPSVIVRATATKSNG